MTAPNKITVFRIISSPIFYALFCAAFIVTPINLKRAITTIYAVLWLVSEISDVVDGEMARRHNLVSDMGKLLDPFSDVLSRITYFACFVQAGIIPMWPLVIIFWRELSITFMRAVMAHGGFALAASRGGKFKAVFYFSTSALSILFLLAQSYGILAMTEKYHVEAYARLVIVVFFYVATAISVLSFIDYFRLFLRTDYVKKFIKE